MLPVVSRFALLSDARWELIEELLPVSVRDRVAGRRMAGDGTWDVVLQRLLAAADAAGQIDWAVSAIGRSRGAWSTKMHQRVEGNDRPPVALIGPGQAADAPMFPHLMRHLRVARAGRGRGITAVIPEPADQVGRRRRRGGRLRLERLPRPQRRRTTRQPARTTARPDHPLRQTRHRRPLRGRPPRRDHLDQSVDSPDLGDGLVGIR